VARSFPTAWEPAWLGYEIYAVSRETCLTIHPDTPLDGAAARPEVSGEVAGVADRRELTAAIAGLRRGQKPGAASASFHDLRSFFQWLAEEPRSCAQQGRARWKGNGSGQVGLGCPSSGSSLPMTRTTRHSGRSPPLAVALSCDACAAANFPRPVADPGRERPDRSLETGLRAVNGGRGAGGTHRRTGG
jgi:hypothetical protein